MTPEEFKKEMLYAQNIRRTDGRFDQEYAHRYMDRLMCDLLRELGYGEGVEIFEDTPKWYA